MPAPDSAERLEPAIRLVDPVAAHVPVPDSLACCPAGQFPAFVAFLHISMRRHNLPLPGFSSMYTWIVQLFFTTLFIFAFVYKNPACFAQAGCLDE